MNNQPRPRGELWTALDWALWGVGMADFFRVPIAEKMIASLPDDEFKQAEAVIADWNTRRGGPQERNLFAELRTRAEAAEATLERVRALHRVDQYTEGRAVTRCVCEEEWPCSTMAALAPVTEEGDKDA